MSDKSVGVYDAKSSLTKLSSDVQNGDTVTITRHGKPIARIVPVVKEQQQKVSEAIEALRTFHRSRKLNGPTIRELIDEGRQQKTNPNPARRQSVFEIYIFKI